MFCVRIWDISASKICKEVKHETHITAVYCLCRAAVAHGLRGYAGRGADADSDAGRDPNETEVAAATALPEGESNILVAYFSWADNAILAEDVDAVASPSVVPPGNVQQLAGWVQEATAGICSASA